MTLQVDTNFLPNKTSLLNVLFIYQPKKGIDLGFAKKDTVLSVHRYYFIK